MSSSITLTLDQYTSLIGLARKGAGQQQFDLEELLKGIETANSIRRYLLWVQWQNPTAPLPPGVRFPETWPPELRHRFESVNKPILKDDVLNYVTQKCPNAVNILVTPDPSATLGWTQIDVLFPNS
jgi:hypothetical protein